MDPAIPAFVEKLWHLVCSASTDDLIFWSWNGLTFNVCDEGRFFGELLSQYFKHKNMASFIRQLNMYGFKKVLHLDQGSRKPSRRDMAFKHPSFVRGQPQLLEEIRRKPCSGNRKTQTDDKKRKSLPSSPAQEESFVQLKHIRNRQDAVDANIARLSRENVNLWRNLTSLKQKLQKQNVIVTKLLKILMSVKRSQGPMGPMSQGLLLQPTLMLDDAAQQEHDKSDSAFSRPLIEELLCTKAMELDAVQFQDGDTGVIHEPSDIDAAEVDRPEIADQLKCMERELYTLNSYPSSATKFPSTRTVVKSAMFQQPITPYQPSPDTVPSRQRDTTATISNGSRSNGLNGMEMVLHQHPYTEYPRAALAQQKGFSHQSDNGGGFHWAEYFANSLLVGPPAPEAAPATNLCM